MSKINWYPGHMRSSVQQLRQQLQHSDLVIEVRDARAPLASASHNLAPLLAQHPTLLILNKADLADPATSQRWQRQLTQSGRYALSLSSNPQGCKKLLQHLQQHWNDGVIKGAWHRPRRALIVGIPNVGKSSLINALSLSVGEKRQLKVENRAGVTRQIERIALLPQLILFDSPGVLPPNLACQQTALLLSLIGAIKEQILPHHQIGPALVKLLEQLYPLCLIQHFQLQPGPPEELFQQLASKWGFLQQGDGSEKTTRRLLLQLAQGRLGRFTLEHPQST